MVVVVGTEGCVTRHDVAKKHETGFAARKKTNKTRRLEIRPRPVRCDSTPKRSKTETLTLTTRAFVGVVDFCSRRIGTAWIGLDRRGARTPKLNQSRGLRPHDEACDSLSPPPAHPYQSHPSQKTPKQTRPVDQAIDPSTSKP